MYQKITCASLAGIEQTGEVIFSTRYLLHEQQLDCITNEIAKLDKAHDQFHLVCI